MPITKRLTDVSNRNKTYFVDLSNAMFASQHINSNYLVSRRARFDDNKLHRIIICLIQRRLQPNAATPYSREFDERVIRSSFNVPHILNIISRHLPLNGARIHNAVPYTVSLTDKDGILADRFLYNNLVSDLTDLNSFCVANNINLQPVMFKGDTVPNWFKRIQGFKIDTLQTIDSELVDSVTVKYVRNSTHLTNQTAYHGTPTVYEIRNIESETSLLFPMFVCVEDISAVDGFDIHFNCKIVVVFDYIDEHNTMLTTVIRDTFLRIADLSTKATDLPSAPPGHTRTLLTTQNTANYPLATVSPAAHPQDRDIKPVEFVDYKGGNTSSPYQGQTTQTPKLWDKTNDSSAVISNPPKRTRRKGGRSSINAVLPLIFTSFIEYLTKYHPDVLG